ncbi:hypothetical protein LTR15_002331 [Elasticomyces elasticus]|nr:hypothetical protein LTR15_002331 [Elasticomyces elasticus]
MPHKGANPFAEWHGDETFSDVTLKYDGCEFKAHRIALSSGGTVELDEPGEGRAVEAMVRYLYTDHYFVRQDERRTEWRFHLSVAAVAKKYQLAELRHEGLKHFDDLVEEQMLATNWRSQLEIAAEADGHDLPTVKQMALIGFNRATNEFPNMEGMLDLFKEAPGFRYLDESVKRKEMALFKIHFLTLLQVPEQAKRVDEQPGLALHYLVKLAEMLLQLRTHIASCGGTDLITVGTLDQLVQGVLNETAPAELA